MTYDLLSFLTCRRGHFVTWQLEWVVDLPIIVCVLRIFSSVVKIDTHKWCDMNHHGVFVFGYRYKFIGKMCWKTDNNWCESKSFWLEQPQMQHFITATAHRFPIDPHISVQESHDMILIKTITWLRHRTGWNIIWSRLDLDIRLLKLTKLNKNKLSSHKSKSVLIPTSVWFCCRSVACVCLCI